MDKYNELVDSAQKHASLYHYTRLVSIQQIFKNKSLRMSRIDKVNDSQENDRIKSMWHNKVYVLCFTHGQNNAEYFYQEYGEIRLEFSNNDITIDNVYFDSKLNNLIASFDDYGRRSKILHSSYEEMSDWCVFDISSADVYYSNNLDSFVLSDGFETNAGLIKAKNGVDDKGNVRNWEVEAETRIRIALRPIGLEAKLSCQNNSFYYPIPKFEYLYIHLPRIKSIDISPFISVAEKNRIIREIIKYRKTIQIDRLPDPN